MKRRLLVSWIGHSDLRAMTPSLLEKDQAQLLGAIGGRLPASGDRGPTGTLLATQRFDEVRLLSNYDPKWNKAFRSWAAKVVGAERPQPIEVRRVELQTPTDYAGIYRIAEAELADIRGRKDWQATQLCLHLSPGTPAMAAVWLLLGKTRFPATFYETHGGKSWETSSPCLTATPQ